MISTLEAARPAGQPAELEAPLAALEDRLAALGLALQQSDAEAVDRAGAELHHALVEAVEHFRRAARSGGVPAPLRRRLALAGAQVAAQREALARATASLDRAIDVLMPRNPPRVLYTSTGTSERTLPASGLLA
jgi:hypothetical protein